MDSKPGLTGTLLRKELPYHEISFSISSTMKGHGKEKNTKTKNGENLPDLSQL